MKLTVKRSHIAQPWNIRFLHGQEIDIEPDKLAEELIKRGWFVKAEEKKEAKKGK